MGTTHTQINQLQQNTQTLPHRVPIPSHSSLSSTSSDIWRITYHSHDNTLDLLRIFRLFLQQPFQFIHSIQLQIQQHNCCNRTILKVKSPKPVFTLDSLLGVKRVSKTHFVQKQIWYIIKSVVSAMIYMQAQGGTVLGVFNPRVFTLQKGKFIMLQVLHLLPYNQHEKQLSLHNYYSPQKLKSVNNQIVHESTHSFDIFKSEVFSFGLLLLEIATCPASKPKFHKSNLKEIIWSQISLRFQMMRQKYSQKLAEFIQIMLREDVRTRADWTYLKTWMKINERVIDVAPCIFWSI